MDTHSSWRNEDILGLIPELSAVVTDPSTLDPALIHPAVRQSLQARMAELQAVIDSDDYKIIQTGDDIDALFRVMEKMETLFGEAYPLTAFLQLVHIHYPHGSSELVAAVDAASEELQGFTMYLNQSFGTVVQIIANLDNERLQAALAHPPERQRFAPLVERCREMKNAQLTSEDDFRDYNFAVDQIRRVGDSKLSEDERKQAFADGMTGMMRFKHKQANSLNYKDTLEQFAHMNKAPVSLIHELSTAVETRAGALANEFSGISELVRERIETDKILHPYSWEEAKDITCAAYARLDPELGILARRAFDEGWILARNGGIPNPFTIGGPPVSQSPQGHPFGAVAFSGDAWDLIILGHEMGHVLSNHIAGEKHGPLTHSPSLLVQESFSHFGEVLMEQEMMARAEGPVNKAAVQATFASNETDVVSLAAMMKFEEDLYHLVGSKGDAAPSFDEINALYRENHEALEPIMKGELDVRHTPAIWSLLNQPPHTLSVYPITKIMASALYEAFEQDPERFRLQYKKMMEAGGTIGINDFWDAMLGKGAVERPSFLTDRVEKLFDRVASVKAELLALPVLEKLPEPEPEVAVGAHNHIKPTSLIERAQKSNDSEITR